MTPEAGVRDHDGIVDLLPEPPDFVRREAAGLGRFAERMRQDGWGGKRPLRCRTIEERHWYNRPPPLNQFLDTAPVRARRDDSSTWIEDAGPATSSPSGGWRSFALDIANDRDAGSEDRRVLLRVGGKVHFERVLATMFDVPIAERASLDYVFCCEVLHHNDALNAKADLL